MTVIRDKPNYKYPKPVSGANSDTESLHLGSTATTDTESLHDEPISSRRVFRPPPLKISHFEELINVKKSGKKKMRRYENKCILQTLTEEDEEDNFIVIMETYKSPFARLLDDENALAYWNDFIEKSEEEQTKIVKAFSKRYCSQQSDEDNAADTFKVGKPGKISSRLRRTIKIRKNLSLDIVKVCEDDLIAFFRRTPSEVYVKTPPTSFDRLLVHAIAQYHQLKSISEPVEDGNRRSVQVYNILDNWVPAENFLTEFVRDLRK